MIRLCTRSRNRTDILVKELVFETSASTNSAIRARNFLNGQRNYFLFSKRQVKVYTKLCRSYNFLYTPFWAIRLPWVPRSTILPFCITIISSAFLIVDNLWAITIEVRLVISLLSASCTKRSDSASSAEVASSKISIGGF